MTSISCQVQWRETLLEQRCVRRFCGHIFNLNRGKGDCTHEGITFVDILQRTPCSQFIQLSIGGQVVQCPEEFK